MKEFFIEWVKCLFIVIWWLCIVAGTVTLILFGPVLLDRLHPEPITTLVVVGSVVILVFSAAVAHDNLQRRKR